VPERIRSQTLPLRPAVASRRTWQNRKNVWVEHMTCGFWVGGGAGVTDRLTIDGCRCGIWGPTASTLCNGTRNSLVTNTTVRCSGDDGIAIWSAPEMDGTEGETNRLGCTSNIIANCHRRITMAGECVCHLWWPRKTPSGTVWRGTR